MRNWLRNGYANCHIIEAARMEEIGAVPSRLSLRSSAVGRIRSVGKLGERRGTEIVSLALDRLSKDSDTLIFRPENQQLISTLFKPILLRFPLKHLLDSALLSSAICSVSQTATISTKSWPPRVQYLCEFVKLRRRGLKSNPSSGNTPTPPKRFESQRTDLGRLMG